MQGKRAPAVVMIHCSIVPCLSLIVIKPGRSMGRGEMADAMRQFDDARPVVQGYFTIEKILAELAVVDPGNVRQRCLTVARSMA